MGGESKPVLNRERVKLKKGKTRSRIRKQNIYLDHTEGEWGGKTRERLCLPSRPRDVVKFGKI